MPNPFWLGALLGFVIGLIFAVRLVLSNRDYDARLDDGARGG